MISMIGGGGCVCRLVFQTLLEESILKILLFFFQLFMVDTISVFY